MGLRRGRDVRLAGPAHPHTWVYRGQVLSSSRQVTTQAVITARDDERRWLKADGYLLVDGKVIYQMNDFTLRLDTRGTPTPARGT